MTQKCTRCPPEIQNKENIGDFLMWDWKFFFFFMFLKHILNVYIIHIFL